MRRGRRGEEWLHRLRILEQRIATSTFTCDDGRGLVRVSVDGHGRVQAVELAPEWTQGIHVRDLADTVRDAYRAARRRASDFVAEKYAETGVSVLARSFLPAGAGALPPLLDRLAPLVPNAGAVLAELGLETVVGTAADDRVLAEFDCFGELRGLVVSWRYALQTPHDQLAESIRAALSAGEMRSAWRNAELSGRLSRRPALRSAVARGEVDCA
jgi:DNA-binding protein YbaB